MVMMAAMMKQIHIHKDHKGTTAFVSTGNIR